MDDATYRDLARQFAIEQGHKDVADSFADWHTYQDVEPSDIMYSLFNFLADREEAN